MESHFRRLQQADGLSQLRQFAQQNDWRIDWNFNKLLLAEEKIALVTDPSQVICFATPNIIAMNGYRAEEIIGKRPSMFQGKDTEPAIQKKIREAISQRKPFRGIILNYRKEGTPYRCLVEEYPVWNRQGRLVHFIAFEKVA
jgi:PAS domain S-box-containing protein